MENYELTDEQKKAFRALELALLKCDQAGLYIWSNYGTLSAVNGEVVKVVAPDESLGEPLDYNKVSSILSKDIRENADDDLFVKRVAT